MDPTPFQALVSQVGQWVSAAAGYMGSLSFVALCNDCRTSCMGTCYVWVYGL